MPQFLFVRHGQSQANADKIIGDDTTPLSSLGRRQAKATGETLKHTPISRIIASPAKRAQETAQIIATAIGYTQPITSLELLAERDFGPLKNQPKAHESLWYFDSEYPGVEPRQVLLDRMHQCLQQLDAIAQTETLLVVGHAASGFFLFQAALGRSSIADLDPSFQLDNAGTMTITYEKGGAAPQRATPPTGS